MANLRGSRSIFVLCSVCRALLLCILLLFAGCGTSNPPEKRSRDFRSIAQERFGAKAEFSFNGNRTHVICFEQSKPSTEFPLPRTSFFLFDIDSGVIILEESLNGAVSWEDDEHIRIDYVQGIVESSDVKGDHDSSYLFDIRTQQRTRRVNENLPKKL